MRKSNELLGRLQDVKHDTELAITRIIRDDTSLKHFDIQGVPFEIDIGVHPVTKNRELLVKRNGTLGVNVPTETLLKILEHLEDLKGID